MKESPLFWPVKLRGDVIYCLDETALPQKLIYLKAKTLSQAVGLIKTMKTRAFGQVLMVYNIFLLTLKKNRNLKPQKQIENLEKVALKINKSRPTFPFPFFTQMILFWAKQAENSEENIFSFTKNRIENFLINLREKRLEQAEKMSRFIKDGDCILTHCNVSGSLVMTAEFCRKQNKKIKIFATETRPYLQGSRLTAWELQRSGFEVTIIPDNAVALLMLNKLVNLVVVGADQTAQNGDIANKIGTYQIAILAKHFKIPFYVFAPPPSKAKTRDDIKIEIRPEKELLEFNGKRIAPKKTKGFYPAFDITPNNLITKHITLDL